MSLEFLIFILGRVSFDDLGQIYTATTTKVFWMVLQTSKANLMSWYSWNNAKIDVFLNTILLKATLWAFTYLKSTVYHENDKAKKKYMCVYCHMSKKSRGGRSGLIFFFFFIIDKTGNSSSRYLIFENSGKMTNYAVFLPSLLSISTKS